MSIRTLLLLVLFCMTAVGEVIVPDFTPLEPGEFRDAQGNINTVELLPDGSVRVEYSRVTQIASLESAGFSWPSETWTQISTIDWHDTERCLRWEGHIVSPYNNPDAFEFYRINPTRFPPGGFTSFGLAVRPYFDSEPFCSGTVSVHFRIETIADPLPADFDFDEVSQAGNRVLLESSSLPPVGIDTRRTDILDNHTNVDHLLATDSGVSRISALALSCNLTGSY